MSDPYLTALHDSLNDSAMQRKFRRIAPMPFGVVFLPWAGMTEEDMRGHFREMKRLGFTNLKQTMPTPEWSEARILAVAHEEGIIPFWYGEGGWEDITDELLDQLDIPRDTPMPEIREDARMREYQHEVIKRRIGREKISAQVEGTVLQEAGMERPPDNLRLHNDPVLWDDSVPFFKQWVKAHYPYVETLNRTWNLGEVGICERPYESWEDFDSDETLTRFSRKNEYRHVRDILRFKADHALATVVRAAELSRERDPDEPQRAGGEMGLFLPFAWRGTDMEGFARAMREHGSFYPSIHLAWHFEEVEYEVARCIYMQASLAADWFKGGWSATWESTGGPQQFSGGKAWNAKSAEETAGYTVDAGTMSQLLLSYLAAGFKGVGLWSWNPRQAGWEAGEYALLDRQNRAGTRAERAGAIARAANQYRDELWAARKEPLVGVYVDWDNEALWAAMSVANRDQFRFWPVHARIGASRALVNGNVPWEHLTANDLRAGLAGRYRTIILPAHIAISEETLALFAAYVEAGGRVVLDAPGAWFDMRGRLLDTGAGSAFERLFGVEIRDYQYSNNVPRSLDGRRLDGFILDLHPTTAETRAAFDECGPASTENALGSGTAVVLAWEATHQIFRPGEDAMESRLRDAVLGGLASPYRCDGALVYRLAAPAADHYFFVNDGPAREVRLETDFDYASASDPVSGDPFALDAPIALESHGARWSRMEKRR